jgi:hypothetical protein
MIGRLLDRLDEFERELTEGVGREQPGGLRAIDSARLGLPSISAEAAAIDTLAIIFEAIFALPTLPDPIKMVLSSLQIPTLRAAILDPGLFTADAHPARLLLDKVARVAAGLAVDVSSRHPLCVIVQQVAARVRTEFIGDTAVLNRAIGELDKLIARRDAAAGQSASGYRPLLQQLEQGDLADQRARMAIDEYCARPDIPPAIAKFLRDHWQRLLRQIWLEAGEDSGEWKEHQSVVERLLWSVQPKTDLDERKQLARELPRMLECLTAGMQRIGVSDSMRADFLDTCFALQTAALRSPDAAAPEKYRAGRAARPVAPVKPALSELQSGVHRLRIYDMAGVARAAPRHRQSAVRTGDWLTFRLADEEPICGRICHVSKITGKLLLANPDWEFAVLLHPAIVDIQLQDGVAQITSRISLFNAAAERALGQGQDSG